MDQFWTRIQYQNHALGLLRCKVNRKTNTWSLGMTVKNPYLIELGPSSVSEIKSDLLRSVLILRHDSETNTCILEAVSTRTKKGHIKDPLQWCRLVQDSRFQDIAHQSRMRLQMTVAEAFAFQILKCKVMKLYDAATVPIGSDGLQPLTILSLLQCGQTTQEKYGYSCQIAQSRHLFRTVRNDLQKTPKEAFSNLDYKTWSQFAKACTDHCECTEDLDACLRDWTSLDDSEKARQAFQQWYSKPLKQDENWNINLMKMRSPEPWMVTQNDRWKDTQ